MKRSLQVTIAAIVVMLGSFVTSLVGLSMLLLLKTPAATPPETPFAMHSIAIGEFLFFSFLAVLGFSTAVGIFQRWRWARYSMIIFGVILACIALVSLPVILVVMRMAPNAGLSANGMRFVSIFVSVIYLILAIIGVWFAYLFSRNHVAEYFRGEAVGATARVNRPLPITIVAVFMLFGIISIPFLFFSNMPLFFMGQMLHGSAARIVFLIWMVVYCVVGLALFRLKPLAWKAAVGVFLFGVVNQLSLLLPGRLATFEQALRNFGAYGKAPESVFIGARVGLVLGMIGIAVPICLLLVSRAKFYAACAEAERLALAAPEHPSL